MTFLGLGTGMDLQWCSTRGFKKPNESDPSYIHTSTQNFLNRFQNDFSTFFFSFQRRSYGGLKAEEYLLPFEELSNLARKFSKVVNLHHTMLNLGSTQSYNRKLIYEVTNKINERCNFGWINEDVGIWFLKGKSLPYPLPPILTKESLAQCVQNTIEARKNLTAPLSIEFPGFTEGASFFVGNLDAYEFFAELASRSEALVTLDTGHLIGWEYLCGRQGEEMYLHLENFPFEQVIEIHMSGSELKDGKFYDRHHGILLNEQVEMLDFLLPRCKNLKVVT